MTVDATRQDHYPDFDLLHDRPGLWSDIPSSNLDARSSQNICSQFDLVAHMAFHANMFPEYLSSQSLQGQQWTGREACRSQPQSPCSSPLQSQHGQIHETRDFEEETTDIPDQRGQQGNDVRYTDFTTSQRGQRSQSRSLPVGHLRHQSSVDFGEDLLRNSHDTIDENIFADWAWGPRERSGRRAVREGSMQWGSDSGFDSPRGSLASISGDEMDSNSFPHVNGSEKEESGLTALSFGYRTQVLKPTTGRSSSLGEHPTPWPVLRTRTGSIDPDVVSTYRALSMEYLGSEMHERKPLATVGPRREKLTEQQRRRNHILHEKKRRALIKDGFDDLLNLVPDVKDRGLSKSAILLKAAEWLSSLICENKALRAQARALEGADTMPSPPQPASPHQKSHRRINRRI
ncbi:hypothetical protein J3459_011215 [Metarhizium acridum]|nr:hypothetical protein J3459_011215 [Metarhizium acridum]